MLVRLLARLTGRRRPTDEEISRELRDHLELDAEALASHARGTSQDAWFGAQRRFGNVSGVGETVRDVWRFASLEHLEQDIRHGLRAIVRSPLYAAAVIVTLALGIGAAASMYSLSRAIHHPFPRLPQDRLLWITMTNAVCGVDCTEVSPAGLAKLQTEAPSITAIGTSTWRTALRSRGGSEMVSGFVVSPNTFETVGAPFAIGHGFPSGAGRRGGPDYTVLSYDFWRTRFNASPGVLDSVITLGGRPYTVTGVLAKDVIFPMAADLYSPSVLTATEAADYASRQYAVFARLAPEATMASAAAEVRTISARLAQESPKTDSGWVVRARPIAEFHTDDVQIMEQISGLAAALVFLAACMSAANLALSRLATRRHELALRAALGVRRWRLARHLLSEALLLSLAGGVIGALLARWGVLEMRQAIPADFAAFLPGWARLGLDEWTLAFTFGAAIVAMLAFAVLPVMRATRVNLAAVLSEDGRASSGGVHGTRTRATLVVVEVSIALVLLTAATLCTRSVRNMITVDAGVRLDHVLTMHLTLPAGMRDSSQIDFYRRLDENLRMTPGVRSGGAATTTPLSNNYSGVIFRVPGRAPEANGHVLSAIDQHVTPGYPDAAGIHVEEGRMIAAQDESIVSAQRAIVINRYMADALWPHASAIGRVVTVDNTAWTIVGVASNVHHGGLDEPMRYTIYRSQYQSPRSYGELAVWTTGDPALMRDAIRAAIARTDPSVAAGGMMTMQQMQARHVSPYTMMAAMLAVLAVVTLTIATVGLYGLIAYGVAQRTREIGVRIALGAQTRDILAHVGGGAVRLTIIGIVFGVAGAALFGKLLATMLYGVSASDPRTYVAVSVALLIIALSAALVPSWRAARVDPMEALRR